MKIPDRSFSASPAVRTEVPALVGLMGASGSGKTYSALRLATGMQKVRGGEIYVVDTEARRALHYADQFKFQHVPFGEPFGSLDYLSVLRYCVIEKGASVVVIDSMSHEHEGVGGYLQTQEAELDRMAGSDHQKRERVKFAAWIKPAAQRRALINGLLQLNAAFVFCFRAKEKTKPVPGGQPLSLGFMPIAGEEFVFEMTMNALLMPHSDGVPTWQSDKTGERLMMKLPTQFRDLFARPVQITEEHGAAIAQWAKGGAKALSSDLPERLAAAANALKGANTIVGLEKIWGHAKTKALLAELDMESAEGLELTYESRRSTLTEVA